MGRVGAAERKWEGGGHSPQLLLCKTHTLSSRNNQCAAGQHCGHSNGNRGTARVAASARRQVRGSQIGQPGQRRQGSHVPSHAGAAENPEDGAKLGRQR